MYKASRSLYSFKVIDQCALKKNLKYISKCLGVRSVVVRMGNFDWPIHTKLVYNTHKAISSSNFQQTHTVNPQCMFHLISTILLKDNVVKVNSRNLREQKNPESLPRSYTRQQILSATVKVYICISKYEDRRASAFISSRRPLALTREAIYIINADGGVCVRNSFSL